MTPREIAETELKPRPSTTAYPHRVSPGSIPSTLQTRDFGPEATALLANTGSNTSGLTGLTGDLCQLTDQFVDRAKCQAGNGAVGVTNDALTIDNEDAPSGEPDWPERAVQASRHLLGISQEWEGEAVLGGKCVMAGDVLSGYSEYLGIHLGELL